MIALDTNVVIRLLVNDDADQHGRAVALLARTPVYVPDTVLLETEWVLRKGYRQGRDEIATAFHALASMEGVEFANPDRLASALQGFRSGLDFADALHLATCDLDQFATFNRRLFERAPSAFDRPAVVSP